MTFLVLTNLTITLLKEKENDLKLERERGEQKKEKKKTEKAVVAILDIGFTRDDYDDINWLQMRKEGPRAIVNDSPKRDGPKPNDMK